MIAADPYLSWFFNGLVGTFVVILILVVILWVADRQDWL